MSKLSIGDKAPEFEAETYEGNPVRLNDYKDKKTVVFFSLLIFWICLVAVCLVKSNELLVGGCCVSMDDPAWACADCEVRIYKIS